MTEVKIANYTLATILLIVMTTFCISISALEKNNSFDSNPTILAGYVK